MGQIVLALPLGEIDDRHPLVFGELVQPSDEVAADRLQQRGRRDRAAALVMEERHHTVAELQLGYIHVQVHPVDAFHLEGDVLGEDISGAAG
jgi:hypothetical protein